MKARHPAHPMQALLNKCRDNFPADCGVKEASACWSDLLGQIEWFAQKAKVTEVEGMYEVRNEKGYTVATFTDKQPAKRFADLINLVSGGGE